MLVLGMPDQPSFEAPGMRQWIARCELPLRDNARVTQPPYQPAEWGVLFLLLFGSWFALFQRDIRSM